MNFVVVLAAIASCVYIARKSLQDAFIKVYLPVALCLPAWARWVLPGLPDPTFQQAALLPIAAVLILRRFKGFRISLLDPFVFGLVFVIGLSEYVNAGYAEAQNLMFDMLASGLLPYVSAKYLLQSSASRVRFMRSFVWCTCLVVLVTLYEVKFASNLYRVVFDRFFPGQGDAWVTTFRYGLPRVAGPYGHAILAGIIFMITLRLQAWLQGTRLWEPRFSRVNFGSLSKAQVLTACTFLGLCLTWVRGPQIGALLAWMISVIGRGPNPRRRMAWALSALVVFGIPLAYFLYSYVSVGRAAAVTASQESAAYRKELVDLYFAVAMHHAWLGWGRNTWPKIPSMPSIDNYYLLLGLMHGIIAVALLVAVLAIVCTRLYKAGVRTAVSNPVHSSLSFNLLGIYIGFAFSIGTVYLGENVVPVFFTLLGFTEAFLMNSSNAVQANTIVMKRTNASLPQPRFRRVVA